MTDRKLTDPLADDTLPHSGAPSAGRTEPDPDAFFMSEALREAQAAAAAGEVPVGAVIVRDGEILARCGNRRERDKCALAHAEADAIREACRVLGGWRLPGCTLYVTLEPCPMCAGAIVNARISRVVIGAKDPRAGAMGSLLNLNAYPLNHKPSVTFGVLGSSCAQVLQDFFRARRPGRRLSPDSSPEE